MMLGCVKCGELLPAPVHCGRPMHLETVNGKEVLVCWMGASCGIQDIPEHCGKPVVLISQPEEPRVEFVQDCISGYKFVGNQHDYWKAVTGKQLLFTCSSCNVQQPIPMHCGEPMHIDTVDGKEMLTCWMGSECGKQDIPEHCGNRMEPIVKAAGGGRLSRTGLRVIPG